ncbi:MAG: hypothetical protein HC884_16595 [Chloroflexaceae bacterium]|nr:hypothetical protein [Chloroflexaceae bacterium]
MQHWFFEQDIPERHHWNQAMLLETAQPLDVKVLQEVLQQLMRHHDALRLRFVRETTGWRQFYAEAEETGTGAEEEEAEAGTPLVERVDVSALPRHEQDTVIQDLAASRQGSLNLSEGPLVRLVFFDCGLQPGRLLFTIHHLVVDAVSWRILLEDFQTAYQQRSQGAAIALPAKTTSLQYWSERLSEYAQHPDLEQEMAFWSAPIRTRVRSLPLDYPEGQNRVASLRSVAVTLSADRTQALLHEVPQVARTEVNEVLLTALTQVVTQWSGSPLLLVEQEGHGREPLFDDVDLSRTVGWFTAVYPVVLDVANLDDPGAVVSSVRQQLRRVPHRGIGYGALRYLSQSDQIAHLLRSLPQAEVSFLYLGQLDQAPTDHAFLTMLPDADLPTRSPEGMRKHLFEISAMVQRGQLHVEWRYSANLHRPRTIEMLAERYLEALSRLIDHCRSSEVGDGTPADLSLAGLNMQQLSQVSRLLEEIDTLNLPEEPGI